MSGETRGPAASQIRTTVLAPDRAVEDDLDSTPIEAVTSEMISPPPSWADADNLVKRSRERRLIDKTRLVCDFGQSFGGLCHELFRSFNPTVNEPLMG